MNFFARNKILFSAALGFALLISAWVVLLTIASKNPVATVPLKIGPGSARGPRAGVCGPPTPSNPATQVQRAAELNTQAACAPRAIDPPRTKSRAP